MKHYKLLVLLSIMGCFLLAFSHSSKAQLLAPREEFQNPTELTIPYEPSTEENEDPIESFNRLIFGFNELIDGLFLEPLAKIYQGVVPEMVRRRVTFALRNLREPVVLANNLLQGEPSAAGDTLGRLLLNSTLGIAGLFDVSSDMGIAYRSQDFGQTLGKWGMGEGLYLVLPLLGPSTLRDLFGRTGDYFLDPINLWAYFDDQAGYPYTRLGLETLDTRTRNLELLSDLKRDSLDYYATLRSWYKEHRRALIRPQTGGMLDSPKPDNDND